MLSSSSYGCPIELTFSFLSLHVSTIAWSPPCYLSPLFMKLWVYVPWNPLEGNLANQKYYNLVG